MRLVLPGLVAAALLGCASPRAIPSPPASAAPLPELQLPRDAVPVAYRLEVTLDPDRERFEGRVEIDVTVARTLPLLYLHARWLDVSSATVTAGGAEIAARLEQLTPEGVARLTPERPLPAGPATLRFAWSAPWARPGVGLYRVSRGELRYAYTQFESVDARGAFPCFDEPGFKAPFEIAILTRPGHVALSNTPETGVERRGELKRVTFARTPPLPTYLVFLGAGPFDVVAHAPIPPNEVRSRPLPLRGFAPRGDGPRLELLLDLHAELTPILERWFGIPFPYEKLDAVARPEVPGAMENAGAITYESSSAYFEEGVSPDGLRADLASLVAHEVSHQWFGDLVTPAWWDDVWLKESFANWLEERTVRSWRPALGTEAERVRGADRAMRGDGLASSPTVRQPLARISEVDAQYNDVSYTKGAAVLEAFARYLGEERFRAALRGYLTAHTGGTGTAADFVASLSSAAGRDLSGAFGSFLDQPGVPLVRVRQVCDAAGARLELAQSRWLPLGSRASKSGAWGIPFCARFEVAGRQGQACTLLEGATGTLPLPGCPAWLLPDAGGSGYHRWRLDAPAASRLLEAGLPHLSPAERTSTALGLEAAAWAGEIPLDAAVEASLRFARDADDGVAQAPLNFLRTTLRVVPPGSRDALARRLAESLRPRFTVLGWVVPAGDPAPRRQLRAELASFLVLEARDPKSHEEAARRGRTYAALGRDRFDASAIDADLAGIALAAAVQEGDERFFQSLADRLPAVTDPELRSRILSALGSATAPATSAAARAMVSAPALSGPERLAMLRAQVQQPEAEQAAWALIKARYDELVGTLASSQVRYLPYFGTIRCDTERAGELTAFFEPRLAQQPSMRQVLAAASERVELCAALRVAQGAHLSAWAAGR
jgi:alanyl aminopeptidase